MHTTPAGAAHDRIDALWHEVDALAKELKECQEALKKLQKVRPVITADMDHPDDDA